MPLSTRTTEPLPLPAAPQRHRRRAGLAVTAIVLVTALGLGVAWWRGQVAGLTVRESCTATAAGRSTSVDPEQAGNAATITAVAVARRLPARAATIGIATALQESKLRNLDYGDRDSLGLFQQRPSAGWGTRTEVMDPVYAANAFYDVLVKVEGYKTASITKAAQKVQRSAYPAAYAQHEEEARILASTLSGYSAGGFDCTLRPVTGVAAQQPGATGYTGRAQKVVTAAKREAGRVPASPAGQAGTAVRYTVTGSESTRLGWSLAHWAVARAAALDVVTVRTDGRQWRRDAPGDGWSRLDGTATVPPGTVEIVVAEGAQ